MGRLPWPGLRPAHRLRGRRAERALRHARVSHVRQLAANVTRRAVQHVCTVTLEMPIVVTALPAATLR